MALSESDDGNSGSDSKSEEKKGKRKGEAFLKRYRQRITMTKYGHEAYRKGDYLNAIKYYNQYLQIVAEAFDLDYKQLSPSVMPGKENLPERLLLSLVYWNLSKIYDLTPQFRAEFEHSLSNFVAFTIDQPFQPRNFKMLEQFITKGKLVHKAEFRAAYQRIQVDSKKCFVATYCFGEEHLVTAQLRLFKRERLNPYRVGQLFVKYYYRYSPGLVSLCEKYPRVVRPLTTYFLRPLLKAVAKLLS